MSDDRPTPPAGTLCEVCERSQVHPQYDAAGRSWYCPHWAGGTLAALHPTTGEWWIRRGIPPNVYRMFIATCDLAALEATRAALADGSGADPLDTGEQSC